MPRPGGILAPQLPPCPERTAAARPRSVALVYSVNPRTPPHAATRGHWLPATHEVPSARDD
eukprot:4979144-Prymnesium_polylepis.3